MSRPSSCLILALLLAFSRQAAAEDTSDLEGLLETTVVSAPSKTPESVSTAPSTSIVLTAEDLRRYGIRSIDEAINYLAFGMITEKNFQSAEIGSRGVLLTSDFGSHVLLMVDGHVLNENWGATAYFDRNTTIPFEIIDHIEIVLGPGSVLYGSNAMLGIVHIVTKRAKDFSGLHVAVESEIPVTLRGMAGFGKEFQLFGSDAELTLALEHYEQKGPTFDFKPLQQEPDLVTGELRDFDAKPGGPRLPAGTWGGKGDTAYYMHAPAGYMRFRVGDLELGARGAMSKRTNPTESGNFDDPDAYELDQWLHLDLKHTIAASPAFRLSTRLYGDIYQYHQYWSSNGAEDCLEGQDSGCLWILRGYSQTVGLEPQLSFDWFEDGRAVTLFGLDGRFKSLESSVDFQDNATGDSNKVGVYEPTEKALAAYLQQTLWVTSWAAINGGARVDIDDRFGSHISPRAAFAILPWDGGTLKAMYSEAFRAPTAFDIYYHDPSTQIPGGDDLEPESVRSMEGTIEQRFGTQTLQVGVFRSLWQKLIVAQELDEIDRLVAQEEGLLSELSDYGYQVRNVSEIDSYGFNLAFEGSLARGRLRYGLSFTEAFARRVEPDAGTEDLLAVAPRVFGNARISYDLADGLPTLGVAARWVGRRPFDNYDPEVLPSPFVAPIWETRVTISGPMPGLNALSYRLSANYIGAEFGAYSLRGGALDDEGKEQLLPNDRLRFAVGLQYDFAL
jgi:outer membrane receptor for ferrienterochelin and colicins